MSLSSKSRREALLEAEHFLKKAKIRPALTEAEIILGHFLKCPRLELYTCDDPVPSTVWGRIVNVLRCRGQRRPLQTILGETQFYGRRFLVSKSALIPRPETEILIEQTIQLMAREQLSDIKILDLGTGSGCLAISLTLERPDCRMTALDKSPKALVLARKNARLHGVLRRIRFVQSDLFAGLKRGELYDLVVSNPPYIPKKDFKVLSPEVLAEPRLALDGGKTGTELIEKILEQAPLYLKKGGWILMEIGKGQSKKLSVFVQKNKSFKNFRFIKDYNQIDRFLILQVN